MIWLSLIIISWLLYDYQANMQASQQATYLHQTKCFKWVSSPSFSSPPPSVPSPFPHGIHSWVKNGEAGTFKGLCKYTTLVRSDQTRWLRISKRASSSVLSLSLVSLGPAIWRLLQSSTTDVEPTLFPFFFCFHCMLRCFADDEILPRIAATSQFLSYSSLTTVSACHWSRQNGLSAAIGRHTIVLLSYWSTQNSVVLPLVGKCLEDSQVSEWTKIMTDLFENIYFNSTMIWDASEDITLLNCILFPRLKRNTMDGE